MNNLKLNYSAHDFSSHFLVTIEIHKILNDVVFKSCFKIKHSHPNSALIIHPFFNWIY